MIEWSLDFDGLTVRKVSKYGVFSGLSFPAFGLNTERCGVSLRSQSEYGKIRTRKNSVLGLFSHSENTRVVAKLIANS